MFGELSLQTSALTKSLHKVSIQYQQSIKIDKISLLYNYVILGKTYQEKTGAKQAIDKEGSSFTECLANLNINFTVKHFRIKIIEVKS